MTPPTRLSRRAFVAAASALSFGFLGASQARASAVDSGANAPSPIPVRVGRSIQSGAAFRGGSGQGVALPGQGGGAGLVATRSGAQFTSEGLALPFPVTHLGLQWTSEEPAAPPRLELRTSRDGQRWSVWSPVQPDSHGRDVPSDQCYSALVTARRATWAQYRITLPVAGAGVSSVGIVSLDAGVTPLGQSRSVGEWRGMRGPAGFLERVVTREQWGADESIRFDPAGVNRWPSAFVTPKILAVHHTATDNDPADPAADVRAIYAYHAEVQGFGDIGYHLLIDSRGQVYEGRRGRDATSSGEREVVSAGIVGGHVLGYNLGSSGIALLGNFSELPPTEAALETLVDALAFEAARGRIDPLSRVEFLRARGRSASDSIWRDNLEVILGHRDCLETECPGDYLHRQLPEIRQAVARRLGAPGPSARILQAPLDRNVWPTDLVVSWRGDSGATEFSTRIEGFTVPPVPDLITPLTGYDEEQRPVWSPWSSARELSMPIPSDASGSFTLMIRARDARGREGAYSERRTFFVDRHVLVDNADSDRTQRLGEWRRVTEVPRFNGRDYEEAEPTPAPAQFQWRMIAPEPGSYRVLACWANGPLRASNAPFSISVNGISRGLARVDQRERGATWVELGTLTLDRGDTCDVTLSNEADGVVVADAVRLVKV